MVEQPAMPRTGKCATVRGTGAQCVLSQHAGPALALPATQLLILLLQQPLPTRSVFFKSHWVRRFLRLRFSLSRSFILKMMKMFLLEIQGTENAFL